MPEPTPATPMLDVQGKCPACGKTSLFLGSGGYVTCSRIECPEPDAASTVLERQPARCAPTPAPFTGERPAGRVKARVTSVRQEPAELAAAVASCPGYETSPNPCRCPCYGCKHHCSAHNPEEVIAAANGSGCDCGHPLDDHAGIKGDDRCRHCPCAAYQPTPARKEPK
ncbi:DUF6085 family protein [Streptomyces formicae]|uniref:Uncharacterized protein n=1 Tax=Streptomyces formicae TaxID=1616117 RepID=A0ABY3WMH0_9ACTN|nr:DUF6085 family protein [Streptomyces formicae]UNM13801.1 hypothetical protein J4032_22165 [Streptomyces formicae]